MARRWVHTTTLRRLDFVLSTTFRRRRRGKSDLAGREIQLFYWNKSSHGACCNGETGVTPSGAGRRRLDSASVTLYWSQYAGDTKWTLMTIHRWNSTYDTKWHSSAGDQGLITRNCSLIQEIQTLMEVMLRLISVSPLMFDIIQKTLPHYILESFGHTSLVKWKFIAMLLLLNSFQCWHDLKHIC